MTNPDVPHSHLNIGGAFSKKIGPAPGWVWVVGVIGIAYGYYWWTHRNLNTVDSGGSSDPSAASTDPSADTSTGTADETIGNADGTASGGDGIVVGTAGTSSASYNWRNPPPGTTFTRNLNGGAIYENWPDGSTHKITLAEYAALGNPKVTTYGKAPSSPVSAKPKPVKNPPGQTRPHTIKVRPGQTLGTLAAKYYGNLGDWRKIKNANLSKLPHNATAETNIKNGITLVLP
jgi:LysM repeat protein